MKKILGLIMVLSIYAVASPVYAGHDHGAQSTPIQGGAQSPADNQNAKESEILINNCVQHVDRIERHVRRLQAQIKDKRAGTSVRDEIKKLEENLKDAADSARSLQIM